MKTRATTTTTTTISDSSDDDNDDAMVAMKPSLLGKLGQSMNVAGISLFLKLAVSDASLAIPHIESRVDSGYRLVQVKERRVYGGYFDKDNTLTIPYAAEVYPPLQHVKECKQDFERTLLCGTQTRLVDSVRPRRDRSGAVRERVGDSWRDTRKRSRAAVAPSSPSF